MRDGARNKEAGVTPPFFPTFYSSSLFIPAVSFATFFSSAPFIPSFLPPFLLPFSSSAAPAGKEGEKDGRHHVPPP